MNDIDEERMEDALIDMVAGKIEFPEADELDLVELALIKKIMNDSTVSESLLSYTLMMRKLGLNTESAIDSMIDTIEVMNAKIEELHRRMEELRQAHENVSAMFIDVPKH